MSDEKRLSKKHAKICNAVMTAGIVILLIGALLIPDTTENLFRWKISAVIIGCVLAFGAAFADRILFKCPHCGEGYAGTQWKKERFCPICGKKIRWE